MTVFRSDVVGLHKLSTLNPLSKKVKFSRLPHLGSGNSIEELVSGDLIDYSAGNTLDWGIDYVTGSNNDAEVGISHILQDPFKWLTESFVYVLDTSRTSNLLNVFSMWGDGRNNWKLGTTVITYEWGNSGTSFPISGTGVFVFHWNLANKTATLYKDGEVVGTHTNTGTNSVAVPDSNVSTRFVDEYFELKADAFLSQTGSFTEEEIATIVADPYQLFETEQQVQDEYQLVTNGTGYGVTNEVFTDSITDDVLTLEFEASNLQNNQPIFSIAESVAASRIFYIFVDAAQNKLMGYFGTSANVTLSTIIDLTDNHEYKITYDGVNNTVVVLQDDIDVSSGDSANSVAPTGLSAPIRFFVRGDGAGGIATPSAAGVAVKYFRFSNVTQGYVHSFNFNRTFGTVIESDTSDLKATLVNFDDGMGSVRAFGVNKGVRFVDALGQYVDTGEVWNPTTLHFSVEVNFSTVGALPSGGLFGSQYQDGFQVRWQGTSGFAYYNNKNLGSLGALELNTDYILRFNFFADGTYTRYLNNVDLGGGSGASLGVTAVTTQIANHHGTGAGDYIIRSAQYIDHADSTNSRYWDLTKITNNTSFDETLNGISASLVNFNDVYVPEKNKTLVAQEFGNAGLKIENLAGVVSYRLVLRQDMGGHDGDNYGKYIIDGRSLGGGWNGYIYNQGTSSVTDLKVNGEVATHIDCFNALAGDEITFNIDTDVSGTIVIIGARASTLASSPDQMQLTVLEITDDNGTYNYDFSIEAGSTIVDTSGNDNHGTVVGGDLRRVYSYSGYGEIVGYRFSAGSNADIPDWDFLDQDSWSLTIVASLGIGETYIGLGQTSDSSRLRVKDTYSYMTYGGFNSNIGLSSVDFNIHETNKYEWRKVSQSQLEFYINDKLVGTNAVDRTGHVAIPLNLINKWGSTQGESSVYQRITLTGSPSNRNYDFTTGDIELFAGGTYVPHVIDSVGGNNGKLVGGVTYDETGATFDGSTGYVGIADLQAMVLESYWEITFIGDIASTGFYLGQSGSTNNYIKIDSFGANVRYSGSNRNNLNFDLSGYSGSVHKFTIKKVSHTECQLLVDDNVVVTDTTDTTAFTTGSFELMGRYQSIYSDGIYVSVSITSSSDNRDYDFTNIVDIQDPATRTLQPAIKETIQGKHATVVNPETSGFMPVLERFVFTASADGTGDYTTTDAFFTDRTGSLDEVNELNLLGDLQGKQQTGYNRLGNFIVQGDIAPTGDNFDGMKKFIAESGVDYTFQSNGDMLLGSTLKLKNIALDCQALTGNERALFLHASDDASIYVEGLHSKVPSSNDESFLHYIRNDSTDPSKLIVKDFYFDAEGKTVGRNLHASTNPSTHINGIIRGGDSGISFAAHCQNVISTTQPFNTGSTGSNNFSGDASAVTAGIGTQVDFANAFNADSTIEQTWAEANLLGTGWNGSNVVQWAWSDAVAADITGTLVVQLGEVQTTSQALHGVNITGTVLSQLQDDLLNGLGSVGATITGVLAEQLGDNIPNYDAIYGNNIVGTLAEMLDNGIPNSIAVHGNNITGSLSETHEGVTPSYVGVFGNSVTGALSINLDENIPSYIGTVGAVIVGALGEQLGDITSNLAGVVGQNITGTLEVNLEVNLPAYSAVLEQPNPSATLAVLLSDTSASSDALHGNSIVGSLSEVHGDNEPDYFGTVGDVISGALSSLLESGIANYNALHGNAITGNASIFMEGIDLSATAIQGNTITGTVNVVLEEDTLNGIIAYGAITGSLGIVSQSVALDALAALGVLLVGNNDVGVTATFDYLDLHFSIALVAADINLSSTLA